MTEYGVTPTGFVLKPLPAILLELEQRQRADIDPEWNTDSDSLGGQYNGIVGDQLAQLWEVLEAVSYSLSRDGAIGASLDIIGSINGTRRKPASKSAVPLTLNLNAGVSVLAGAIVSVTGNPSIRVVTLADVTNGTGAAANVTALAEAEVAGNVTAVVGTLTVIETPVAGWNSATNPEPLGGGTAIESDTAYYQRQLAELAAGGGGTLPGLRADLLHVPGVDAAIVVENNTDAVVDGMPPHSFEAIVLGAGDDAAIAAVIWANKPAGIRPHGSWPPVTITDDQGFDQVIRFSRPSTRAVYAAIAVETTDGYVSNEAVANAVAAAVIDSESPAFFAIGTDAYAGRIIWAAMGLPGVLNARVGLAYSLITDPAAGALSLAIGDREIASLPYANIKVTAT